MLELMNYIYVPASRLEWDSWDQKKDRLIKGGDIGTTLSVSVIMKGRIKGFFEWDGSRYVGTGGDTDGAFRASEIVPIDDYKDEIYGLYFDKLRFGYKDPRFEFFYKGIKVKYKGAWYVFTGKEIDFLPEEQKLGLF